jgi:hypothetical protein
VSLVYIYIYIYIKVRSHTSNTRLYARNLKENSFLSFVSFFFSLCVLFPRFWAPETNNTHTHTLQRLLLVAAVAFHIPHRIAITHTPT